ncbi:MAG: sulfatase-like hydrolase/transferase [Planctomycetes bacterium]|nr:sulfatase-like hydrolase/transferase [Planctomycetota bacterium]
MRIRPSAWLARRATPSLAALALTLGACSGGGEHSVLLVTLDTTRAEALGVYGNPHPVTPNLDRLAAEGVLFEQAYSVAPLTLPAHASMLTGLVPPRHGVRDNGLAALPRSAVTLAERAREAGFQTAAFLGSVVLDEGFGLEQGFERYEAPARSFYNGPSLGYAERPAAEVAKLAAAWLHARDPKRPFFLWAHFWDAHAPYSPAPEMKARAGNNDYLGEVAACDAALGKLLAALRAEGLEDSTLVVVVGDHGESFGEHGELSHGPFVWNTTLRVPLILRRPDGRRAGERVGSVASVVDVYPTALAAMGLEPGGGEGGATLDGLSLLEDEPGPRRGAYFESYYGYLNFGWHPLAGWVEPRGKYLHAPTPRFYELTHDPKEEHDLAPERGGLVSEARGALAELAKKPVLARDAEGLDPELKRTLQAVGYAAFASEGVELPALLAELALPDPHERTRELADVQRAGGLLDGGLLDAEKYAEAETLLRAIVARNPDNLYGWDRLALCLMRMQRHREAIAPLERVLAGAPGNADTWSYLAACRLVVGEEEQALAAFTRALELDPNHVQALGGLVHLMEDAGLGKEAASFKQRFEAVQSRP